MTSLAALLDTGYFNSGAKRPRRLHADGANVALDRTTGTFTGGTGAGNLVTRPAFGRAAFEGIAILGDGTTYLDPDDTAVAPRNGGPGALGLAAGLTGYFGPEDADLGPIALNHGQVRVCSSDNGDEWRR